MDGNDFYYEARTKVNVFLQEQRQITLLHRFLLPFIATGETPTRRTVRLEERCSFPLQVLPGWFPLHMHIRSSLETFLVDTQC